MGYFNGVLEYRVATLKIPFPAGEEDCWHCPLLHQKDHRMFCMRTGEVITRENTRPPSCLLEFEGGNNEIISPTETE